MSINLEINKLHFGSDDAELDEKHGFLDKVFLKTSIYHRVKNDRRELVIGRKGSGKSAICLMLKKAFENESLKVILVSPESLSRNKMEQLKNSSINTDEACVYIWRYVILVMIAREILKKIDDSQDIKYNKKNIKSIVKFLLRNEEIEKNFLQKLISKIPILSNLSVKAYGIEGAMTINSSKEQKEIADELEKFQIAIEKTLRELYESRIIVLVDKVDEIWDQSKESEMMIIGLIKTVHTLNLRLQQTQVILFLRSDIYDILKFHDADKLHSLEERLNWKEKDLKELIATRGKVSTGLEIIDIDQVWNTIFEERVKNEFSFEYILQRTMLRPREVIQFCNQALTEAQDNNHDRIYAQDILNAERQYSAWKLKDLASEFIVQYPYLEELFGLFQGFTELFEYEGFAERFSEHRERLNKKFPNLQTVSIDIVLQILYVVGFLGAIINGKKLFVYDDPTIVLSQQESIVIHPSFISALNIQTNRVINYGKDYFENVGGNIVSGNVYNIHQGSDIIANNSTVSIRKEPTK